MELRFVAPRLVHLDEVDTEVVCCSVWSDARPSHGVAGLCDFRLAGRISALQRKGHITGDLGEVVLLPGKPKTSFDKILLFGAGARATFDEEAFQKVLVAMLDTIEDLASRGPVIELPGRHDNLITPERAADLLLAAAARRGEISPTGDLFTLVEGADDRQRITEHMIEERRRIRRVL